MAGSMRDEADGNDVTLMPRRVRRWMFGGVGVLLALTFYLLAVRGTAILFDLRDAVGSICF